MSLNDIKLKITKERIKWLALNCKRDANTDFKLGIGCFKEKANFLGSGYVTPNYSSLLRKINSIKYGKGKVKFTRLLLNDYGKIEGSSGGYGSSIKNRF